MPKIETFYEVDMRDIYDRNASEVKSLEERIKEQLVKRIANELYKGGHVYFAPPEESPHKRRLEYQAIFHFKEVDYNLKDYVDHTRAQIAGVFGSPIPSVYNNVRNFRGMKAPWGVLDDPDDKPKAVAPPASKPPCNCNQYSFCPFMCR